MAGVIRFSNNSTINYAVYSALDIGCVALGAVALDHPAGAAGGAIFGVSQISSIGMTAIFAKVLIPIKKTDNSMIKWVKSTTIIPATIAAGWKLATLCGVNMSLQSAFILSIAGKGIGVVGLGVCSLAYRVFSLGKSQLSTNPPAFLFKKSLNRF